MIDSTDARVIEESLKRAPGKSIINSINLEDGEERFQRVVPLARRYGAALVVGCIDEDKQQAQAVTRERKLAIAERSFELLTEQYGVEPEDIYLRPAGLPGRHRRPQLYRLGASRPSKASALIKAALPRCKTMLGISNVSFGLPEAGREVLNSVMLYHCVQAGLDLAIVNSEKLQRYPSIPEEERAPGRGSDLVARRRSDRGLRRLLPRAQEPSPNVEQRRSLPLDERLALTSSKAPRKG